MSRKISVEEMEISRLIAMLAKFSKTEIDENIYDFYITEFKELGFAAVIPVLKTFLGRPLNRMPALDEIKAKLGANILDDEQIARDTVQRIKEAVSKFGYCNPEEAAEFVGIIGRHIVQTMGGWQTVCAYDSYQELDIALAQAREYAKVAIQKQRGGYLDEVLAFNGLPEKKSGDLVVLKRKNDL